ncbi:GGDEF domain-containing protein [Pokkaliibacter sp. MBI-7]|uniref:GGDEF domain-containing protein n=1 Tax=Pokkaliibacter sp. MBI-7 TaxID=3040600 RepID=UPI00244B81F8|nr:GGDEF domain-containing protein [Pokkaliibacter sp. MBI-7]MDH2432425.1 GGDEF domain-containing protein [Pokkaliibacter sp. MBI-7]
MDWLDIPTLTFVAQFASIISLAVFIYLWRNNPGSRAFSWLAGSSLCMSLGIFLILGLRFLPAAFCIIAGNASLMYSGVMLAHGTRQLYLRPLCWLYWLTPLPMLLATGYFTLITPDVGARVVTYSATVVIITGYFAYELRRPLHPRGSSARFVLLTVASIDIAVNLLRVWLTLAAPQQHGLLTSVGSNATALAFLNGLLYLSLLPLGFMMLHDERLQLHLQHQADHDDLTQLLSRRAFMEHAEQVISDARQRKHSATLAIIDLDWFKQINDGYGHLAGDYVLAFFARMLLRETHGSPAITGRIGGEEFAVLWPGLTARETSIHLYRLQNSLKSSPMEWDGIPISLTFSSGLAELNDNQQKFDTLYRHADAQLYLAKENGRDCLFGV